MVSRARPSRSLMDKTLMLRWRYALPSLLDRSEERSHGDPAVLLVFEEPPPCRYVLPQLADHVVCLGTVDGEPGRHKCGAGAKPSAAAREAKAVPPVSGETGASTPLRSTGDRGWTHASGYRLDPAARPSARCLRRRIIGWHWRNRKCSRTRFASEALAGEPYTRTTPASLSHAQPHSVRVAERRAQS